MPKRYFTKATFAFLNELEANNEKTWWDANKDRYTRSVKEPSLDFITDFAAHLSRISPHFVADARPVGGSLMRPNRDIRFSKDKTPYKTNIGIQFRHERGKDIHAPGFYLHIEPGSSFAGVGLWHPETPVARRIRQAINDDPAGWKKAAKSKPFLELWSIEQDDAEMLKRVPSDLDSSHPYAEDLKMKSFIAGARLAQTAVTSDSFIDDLAARFGVAASFTRFLCDAIGLDF